MQFLGRLKIALSSFSFMRFPENYVQPIHITWQNKKGRTKFRPPQLALTNFEIHDSLNYRQFVHG